MAAVDLTTAFGYVELLKQVHLPTLNLQILRDTPLLNRVSEATAEELVGSSIILANQFARTSGIQLYNNSTGAVTLPAGGSAQYDQMTLPLRQVFGAIDVPDIAIARSDGSVGSWAEPWTKELEDLGIQLRRIMNLLYIGDESGTLATVVSFTGGSPDVVTVDTTFALAENMIVDFRDGGSDVTNAIDVTISAITSETTFECTISGTPDADDTVVLKDSDGNATNGLAGFVDNTDATFQGIDRTSSYWMNTNNTDNGAGDGTAVVFKPLSLQVNMNLIRRRAGGVKPDFVLCQSDVASTIAWVLYPDRRFDNKNQMEAFDTGIVVNGVPVFLDEDVPDDRMYLVRPKSLVRGQLGGALIVPHMDPDGGNFIQMNVDGSGNHTSTWLAYLKHYGALAARRLIDMGVVLEISPLSGGLYGNTGGTL